MRLARRREAFATALTHELRTPLTALQTYAEMLASGKLDEKARGEYLRTLEDEAARLGRVVENVLAAARIERNLRVVPADARELVERARPRLEARAARAGVALEISVDEGLACRADVVAVGQILDNLVDNACKYAGGTRITIAARREGARVELSVTDEGAGVTGDVQGSGIGLELCRRLAGEMGGELVLVGSTATLRLRSK
jgi:signal transduction histidine kinase